MSIVKHDSLADLVSGSLSDNTLRAYRTALTNVDDLSEKSFLIHLRNLKTANASRSSISTFVSAFSLMCELSDLPKPDSPKLKRAVKAAKMSNRSEPVKAKPLTVELVQKAQFILCERDFGMVLLAFAGALRRSEAVSLHSDQFTLQDGKYVAKIEGKTGVREVVYVSGSRLDPCVVLDRLVGSGYLFATSKGHISEATLNRAVKRLVAEQGLNPSEYSSHSCRAGYITEADAGGYSAAQISKQSGHRSMQVLAGYVRKRDTFDVPDIL